MSSNSILDSYQCNQCKERHTNLKKAMSYRAQCFKNHHRRHNDIQTSQTTPVPNQVSVVLNTVLNDTIDRERADAIEDQIMDILNSEDNDDAIMNIFSNDDNDESMYDAKLGNDMDIIENETSPLVFDFSQPAPNPDKDDAKNLEFLKIIKDFGISCNAHEMIVKHFNSILETSTCITYRACTPHLGKKLLKRFSGVEETVHDICQRGCMLFTSPSQTECSNCRQSRYKTRRGETKGDDLVAAATMMQLPLARQLALATLPSTNIRTLESFQNFSQASASSRKGLNGQSPLATLKVFSGPLFFALDEMHGLCHGISKQIWGLASGTYRTDHCFALSSGIQKEIGTAMYKTRNTIPTSFHGDWRDVYKNPGSFKAVDWADFLLFVVPMLVAERIGDATARNALLGLVQACNLLMSWELSAEEQASIKSKLEIWNMYLELLLTSGKIKINIFTINQHLLQHYPLMIDAYGPPRAYSARSMERAIGEYSRATKSNSAINVNAGNIMLGLAQIRQAEAGATVMITEARTAQHLQYEDSTAGWPLTDEDFYESKGEECSMIEAAIQTSRKAFVNGCVIDFALDQNCVREAHNIRLQIQVDENCNINSAYSLVYKDFFGKVVVFFEHKLNKKRWLLALVEIAAVRLVNGIPVVNNGQMKPKVVHLADVKELVVIKCNLHLLKISNKEIKTNACPQEKLKECNEIKPKSNISIVSYTELVFFDTLALLQILTLTLTLTLKFNHTLAPRPSKEHADLIARLDAMQQSLKDMDSKVGYIVKGNADDLEVLDTLTGTSNNVLEIAPTSH
ncbi:hypothetical protein PHYBLDRAFT_173962 [Phycomyces blakesleeanus NRRL 1555(-)]|uniref:Uncharacterized protein n=1 Tax=Phycomyces blakesleeanus (strain ATCC 8743b / DSM 1359 / FGSC 10004 / NBRC 33097 / NRRL 1555) TaxID=763407 RepID=A0A162ZLI6_PHYB8|nr:hypothetical protein PHYBLDRAFT_173962 [Phycomyces blakesleeanus NRRL 1555(-)]OAD67631.1 hypothetical protein PHYBLDRAFT_173962 [Phycomyces blakesleeanus NRRL 1555(-)]|eukprot:XP_018285671.1 hypothetical protein PHYBLDRAFT_173962 [Phycomyces blakesleeanus NRRL 1555(-)]